MIENALFNRLSRARNGEFFLGFLSVKAGNHEREAFLTRDSSEAEQRSHKAKVAVFDYRSRIHLKC